MYLTANSFEHSINSTGHLRRVLIIMVGNLKTILDVKGAHREGSVSVGCCGEEDL